MIVGELLQPDAEYFMSLGEVLKRMTVEGASYTDAARLLYGLVWHAWHAQQRDRLEWVVRSPTGLRIPEDEDEDLLRTLDFLEKATYSGPPRPGTRRDKAFQRFGFFGGEIIPYLAKRGIAISLTPSGTARLSADAREQPDTTPSGARKKTSAKAEKQAKLCKIIDALESYAERVDLDFDREAMPGPLGDDWNEEGSFHWFCAKLCRDFKRAKTTFESYRAGICAVRKYAKAGDFYSKALPHIAPTFGGEKKVGKQEKTPRNQ